MKNFIQSGTALTIPAPAAVASGDVVVLGAIIGVAQTDAESGADVAIVTEGVFTLPKEAPLTIDAGDVVYFDTAAGEVDTTDTNHALGIAVADAASAATTVMVKLTAS